ncbi:MAG: type I restriction enzyme HsdR N-terminal domain-containing protein [Siphonobacter sp.]
MISLNLPPFAYQVRKEADGFWIQCLIRKKWLVLTPEEWVRQHVIYLLTHEYKYPKSLLRIEGGLNVYKTGKRSDLVMYDRVGKPFLLVECKAPHVKINQTVLEQILRYNHVLKAPFLVVSNGMDHFVFQMDASGQLTRLDTIPKFP